MHFIQYVLGVAHHDGAGDFAETSQHRCLRPPQCVPHERPQLPARGLSISFCIFANNTDFAMMKRRLHIENLHHWPLYVTIRHDTMHASFKQNASNISFICHTSQQPFLYGDSGDYTDLIRSDFGLRVR